MILCPVCGTRNEDKARFCGECGNPFAVPEGAEHDFTHGVMRYQPEAEDQNDALPVYVTPQRRETFARIAEGKEVTIQDGQIMYGQTPPAGAPAAAHTKRKTAQKKSSRTAAIIIMSVIGILVILIIFGIVILLRG